MNIERRKGYFIETIKAEVIKIPVSKQITVSEKNESSNCMI
jgi:hypothetical protein